MSSFVLSFSQASRFGKGNRKEINLYSSWNKTGYRPGQSIDIIFNIENSRKVPLKGIELSLIEADQIVENCDAYVVFRRILANILNFQVDIPFILGTLSRSEMLNQPALNSSSNVDQPPTYDSLIQDKVYILFVIKPLIIIMQNKE